MASTMLSNSVLKSKFRGCMVGVTIGDCLGVPFEFQGYIAKDVINIILPDKKRLCNFMIDLANEDSRDFTYTDDTAMTISVASSLAEKGEMNAKDMAERFVEAYFEENRGYGPHVKLVFHKLRKSEFADIFKPASEQFDGSGSFGNGAPMRIAPIALFGYNKGEEYIMNAAKECSLITHAHPNGYRGGILQCLAVYAALRLDPTQEMDPINFIDKLLEKMEKVEIEEEKPYCESLKKMKDFFFQNRDVSPAEIETVLGNGHDVSALKSVPTAIYSFLRSIKPLKFSDVSGLKSVSSTASSFLKVVPSENYFELQDTFGWKYVPSAIYSFFKGSPPKDVEITNPFMRAIFTAVSVGGDSDTIGAMTGALAGAYYGEDGIPHVVQKQCEATDDLRSLADQLFDATFKDK